MTVVIVSKNWETDKTSNAWDLIKHMGFQSRIEQYVTHEKRCHCREDLLGAACEGPGAWNGATCIGPKCKR